MPMLHHRLNGPGLLYWMLVGCVLVSYITPIFVLVTQSAPLHNNIQPWFLNLLALGVVLVTFKPVWKWVQPRIHHVVYAVDDPNVAMLSQLSDGVAYAAPGASMLTTTAETIARTVNLPYVQIETTNGAIATVGSFISGRVRTRIEITYGEVSVGWLEVSSRLTAESLTAGEYQLLGTLARQIGITLHAAQLTDALQTSREHIILAREEERRRLRRDLHDGLGPTLASLRLQLSAVRRTIRQNPEQAEALIDELRDDVRMATAEIRRLVYDLRPPLLDEYGLVGALQNLSATSDGLTRSVEAPDALPLLPAAVEVAVYRIATEALHNAARHAHATHCMIRLVVSNATLTLRVTDDGHGLPPNYLPGVGHSSMQERAAELGGAVSITAPPEGGTCVVVTFPLKDI